MLRQCKTEGGEYTHSLLKQNFENAWLRICIYVHYHTWSYKTFINTQQEKKKQMNPVTAATQGNRCKSNWEPIQV